MTMDRQAHRMVTEILTVLERNGHHRHGGQHTDQAVAMIIDLARIYDGSIDVPVSTGRHAGPTRYPETELPDRQPVPDSFILAGAEISTAFAALDLAAEYKRDLIETCPDCADRSCETCHMRLRDAQAFDHLADRILHRRLPTRLAGRSQPEPDGPAGSPGQADPAPGKEAGQ